jgi:hypothetical protein
MGYARPEIVVQLIETGFIAAGADVNALDRDGDNPCIKQ